MILMVMVAVAAAGLPRAAWADAAATPAALGAPALGALQPSARALALVALQPDDEDPPPRVDRRIEEKPVEVKRVEDDRPIYKKWWFWALTVAVVGATVTAGVLAAQDTPTPPPLGCPPATLACFGDGRMQ
jgi:hypothetical protein